MKIKKELLKASVKSIMSEYKHNAVLKSNIVGGLELKNSGYVESITCGAVAYVIERYVNQSILVSTKNRFCNKLMFTMSEEEDEIIVDLIRKIIEDSFSDSKYKSSYLKYKRK